MLLRAGAFLGGIGIRNGHTATVPIRADTAESTQRGRQLLQVAKHCRPQHIRYIDAPPGGRGPQPVQFWPAEPHRDHLAVGEDRHRHVRRVDRRLSPRLLRRVDLVGLSQSIGMGAGAFLGVSDDDLTGRTKIDPDRVEGVIHETDGPGIGGGHPRR